MKSPKVCFCALSAYPILSKKNTGFIGGAELQQVLIAEELVKNKYDISFIVFDHGQKKVETYNGIKVYKTVPNGLNGYKLSHPKSVPLAARTIWKTLKIIDADIYFQECSGYFTGFIKLFCTLNKKKFIYQIASDMDVDMNYITKFSRFERFLYDFGIKNADCIVAQSEYQKKLLKCTYNKDCVIIKNPYPIEENEIKGEKKPIVIWVGSIKPKWKQPELFLKIAKSLPSVQFQIIGGPSTDKVFYDKIKREAEEISNLEFLGFVPYPEVNKYFNDASILINTSSVEGFSNTFLQAWVALTPVISLNVDPDGIISKYDLGFHSKNMDQLLKDVNTLLSNNNLRKNMGINGKNYVESEHDIKKIIVKYIKAFECVVSI